MSEILIVVSCIAFGILTAVAWSELASLDANRTETIWALRPEIDEILQSAKISDAT